MGIDETDRGRDAGGGPAVQALDVCNCMRDTKPELLTESADSQNHETLITVIVVSHYALGSFLYNNR